MSIEAAHPASNRLPPFERVVELYGPALLRYCAAQVGSERAEDCLQETLLAALRETSQEAARRSVFEGLKRLRREVTA